MAPCRVTGTVLVTLLLLSSAVACGGVAGGERAGAGLGGSEAGKATSDQPPKVSIRNQAQWEVSAELQQQKVGGRAFRRSVPAGETVTFGGLTAEQYAVILTQPNSPGIVARIDGVVLQPTSECAVVFTSERRFPGKGDATIECKP
ncbi:MAG: hypothetical protein HYY02_09990 [Chloroflexi bacterium]|nr:hypothetical protein [Chloroflexota bacterium]